MVAQLRYWFAALILSSSASPALAEVVVIKDDYFIVRHDAFVTVDADQAWETLLSPSRWWNQAHSFSGDASNFDLEARAGGCFCEALPKTDQRSEVGSVRHLEVIHSDPPSLLRMKGGLGPLQREPLQGVFTVTLNAEDEGTRIAFEYAVGGPSRFDASEIAAAVDAVISEQLDRLTWALRGN